MKVSSSFSKITPKDNFIMAGYVPGKVATDKLDDIIMSGLLISVNQQLLLLINIDVCMISEKIRYEINKALESLISPKNVIISATHNHSGPSVQGLEHFGILNHQKEQEYREYLGYTAQTLFTEMLNNLEEVTSYFGMREISGLYSSRLDLNKKIDKTVKSIKFYNSRKELVAEYLNLSVHSTVLGTSNTSYSADLVGNTAKRIHENTGIYPLIQVGAAGDSSTRFLRKGQDSIELDRVSTLLANQIIDIDNNEQIMIDAIKVKEIKYLVDREVDFVKIKDEISKQEIELLIAEDDPQSKLIKSKLFALRLHLSRGNINQEILTRIYHLGKISIITFPLEVDAKLVENILDNNYNLLCNYANDYFGYVINEDEYLDTYEGMSSIFSKGEAEKYIGIIHKKLA